MIFYRFIRVRFVDVFGVKVVYGIDGIFMDSVIFVLVRFGDFDLVVSGINFGENFSIEIMVLGIVLVVIEVVIYEVLSIVISFEVDWKKIFGEGEGIDFLVVLYFFKRIIRVVFEKGFLEGVDMFNVNVLSNVILEMEIVIICLVRKCYCLMIEERVDFRGYFYYWIVG